MPFVASTYQENIFDAIRSNYSAMGILGAVQSRRNIVVRARAGSGKSTTIRQAVINHIPASERVLIVAFNTSVANDMRRKMPERERDIKTYHALGRAGIYAANRNTRTVEQGDDKTKMILRSFLDRSYWGGVYPVITRMVSLVKNTLLDDLSDASLDVLASEYNLDVDPEDSDAIYDAVRRVIREAAQMTDYIDFDDMIWFPHIHSSWVRVPQYDGVLVDELQDTNWAQNILIRAALARGGWIMGVGDEYQSIYAFRGASVDAMDRFSKDFDALELPLSITYRNPIAVVEYVNQNFPEIGFEARQDAPYGCVQNVHPDKLQLQSGDMVLCRMNAPLVPLAFRLIRNGQKATIRGRDIGVNLRSLVRRMKADHIGDLMEKLAIYRDSEVYKLTRAEKMIAAQNVDDKVETIIHVATNCKTVDEVMARIESIFSDDINPIVLSSVHKAKGLEAPNVYIAEPQLIPSRRASTPVEVQQERNIWYVAATRPLETLNFIRK